MLSSWCKVALEAQAKPSFKALEHCMLKWQGKIEQHAVLIHFLLVTSLLLFCPFAAL